MRQGSPYRCAACRCGGG